MAQTEVDLAATKFLAAFLQSDPELMERFRVEQLANDGTVETSFHPDAENGRYELALNGRVVMRLDLSSWKRPAPQEK